MIRLETQLSREDYVELMDKTLLANSAFKRLRILGIILMVFGVVGAWSSPVGPVVSMILFGFMLSIGGWLLMKYFIGRSYDQTPALSERITYNIDEAGVKAIGESFHVDLIWERVHKVTELKDWFFIWENKHVARGIPKRSCRSDDVNKFRKIVCAQPNLKHKLLNA